MKRPKSGRFCVSLDVFKNGHLFQFRPSFIAVWLFWTFSKIVIYLQFRPSFIAGSLSTLKMKIKYKCLYKYRKWEEPQERILSCNEVYFASIEDFNDPFDSRIPFRLDALSRNEQLNWIFEGAKKEYPDQHEDDLWKVAKDAVDSPEHKGQKLRQNVLETQTEWIKKNVGILSLTYDWKNLIMWSHYADSHRGFCVGLSVLKLREFFKRKQRETKCNFDLMAVDYADDYPFVEVYSSGLGEPLAKIIRTKSKFWKYEKEVRLLIHGFTKWTINLPDDIISCVILGCESDNKLQTDIISVLKQKSTKISLYKARMKDLSFGLDFKEIEY